MPHEKDIPTIPSGGLPETQGASGARDTEAGDASAPPQPQVEPGTERRVGPYRLLRELGHGGMGTVYLAVRADEHFHKRVALKVVRGGAGSEAVVRYFKRERQILAGLDHPNIAKLLDGGTTDDGLPYFVMEYVEGQRIDTYCNEHRLPIVERLRLFQVVCAAVQYAHRNLIVHRDLKPGNIIVSPDGVPKLLDFGIATLLDSGASSAAAPTATALLLTPEYASPEQARGEAITTASDVYSLGVVLYELLTGQQPYRFRNRNALEVLRAVVDQEPQTPSAAVERPRLEAAETSDATGAPAPTVLQVSRTREGTLGRLQRRLRGDLDNILMMALRKEPQRRYPSVEALADDIRRYLEGRPVTARRATAGYRAGKFVSRHVAGVAAAAAVVILLVGFAVAMAVQSARVAQERDLAERERVVAQEQQAVAQRERETAERVSAFLVDLFKMSDPYQARGKTITAREILDKGTVKIRTELKDQPEVRATLMDTMGDVMASLGQYDRGIPLLEEALQARKAALGADHLDVAASLTHLAIVRLDMGDYAEAATLYREALDIRRKRLGKEHPDVAESLDGLAGALHEKGDYADAERLYREALAMRRKLLGNEHLDVARTLNNLSTVLFGNGDYAEAESLMRESLTLKRKLLGNEHPNVANGLNNLAALLRAKGDYAGAEPLHREAVALDRKLVGNEHPRVAAGLVSFADTLCREGKPGEAIPMASEALGIYKKAFPRGHPYIAENQSVLGACLTVSRRFPEAEALLLPSYPVLAAKGAFEGREALERIVHLYEAWGKADKAARYKARLAASVAKS